MQAWTSPTEDQKVADALAKTLSKANKDHKNFKGFLIMMTMCDKCVAKANDFVKGDKYGDLSIATLSTDDHGIKDYKVSLDPKVKNTVIVYKGRKVTAKFVNLTDSKEDMAKLEAAIEAAVS